VVRVDFALVNPLCFSDVHVTLLYAFYIALSR
jgi:hypothetical protein